MRAAFERASLPVRVCFTRLSRSPSGSRPTPAAHTPFQLIELALELAHRPGAADVDLTTLLVR